MPVSKNMNYTKWSFRVKLYIKNNPSIFLYLFTNKYIASSSLYTRQYFLKERKCTVFWMNIEVWLNV